MDNEFIFLIIIILEFSLITLAFRLGKEWLFGSIIVNMLLISTFGAKLIPAFGFVSNSGNIFFASVFLATYILTEHYGKKEGYKTAWVGFFALVFFIVMGQLILRTNPDLESVVINETIKTLFKAVPRIALASMIAYLLVQHLNVWVFNLVKEKTSGKHLWLRSGVANISGQLLDSLLFFSIAFLGIIPLPILFQAMLTGFVIKVLVGILATPILYLTYWIKPEEK